MVLAGLAFGGHALWRVPAQGLRAKLAYVNTEIHENLHLLRRAVNGDLTRDHKRLQVDIARARENRRRLERDVSNEGIEEASLGHANMALNIELSQAHRQEDKVQQRLNKEESSLVTSQRDVDKVRVGVQSWQQKFTSSQLQVDAARSDSAQERSKLGVVKQKIATSEQESVKLRVALLAEDQTSKQLQKSDRNLRSQLQGERLQKHGFSSKLRQFKTAEINLLKSLEE